MLKKKEREARRNQLHALVDSIPTDKIDVEIAVIKARTNELRNQVDDAITALEEAQMRVNALTQEETTLDIKLRLLLDRQSIN